MATQSSTSLNSLASASAELTPTEQLERLMKNPKNIGFLETAGKIQTYLKDGKKIEEAVAALFTYYDKMLFFTITQRLDALVQKQFKLDIQALLELMCKVEHPENLSRYEVAAMNVRSSLSKLGEGMRKLALQTYEESQLEVYLHFEDDGKEESST
jgi:hypothetical protein